MPATPAADDPLTWSSVADSIDWTIIHPGRRGVAWMLLAFVLTSILTRVVTRHIRAKDQRRAATPPTPPTPSTSPEESDSGGLIKNVHIGGVHVHHQVWGILLVLVVGALLIAYQPTGSLLTAYAIAFGVGAALALDEFAMWLHLEDVYWSEDGRKSIGALMVAGAAALALMTGADPLDLNNDGGAIGGVILATFAAINLGMAVICVLKGKLQYALIGIFLPAIGPIGAIRLAKPGSWWARKRYAAGSRKLARSQRRFGPAYEARWRKLQDFIGGTPTPQPDAALELTQTAGTSTGTPAVTMPAPPSEPHPDRPTDTAEGSPRHPR